MSFPRAPFAVLSLFLIAPLPAAEPRNDQTGDPLPAGAVARLGTIRWRAGSTIMLSSFLPDGKSLLTVSQDSIAIIWDLAQP